MKLLLYNPLRTKETTVNSDDNSNSDNVSTFRRLFIVLCRFLAGYEKSCNQTVD